MPPVYKTLIQLVGSDFAPSCADRSSFVFEVILILGAWSVSAVEMPFISSSGR